MSSKITRFFTTNPASAPFWLLVRVWLGYQWLMAGYGKLTNPAWFGSDAGAALGGFVQGALSKTGGLHPDVQGWYASFLQGAVVPNLTAWSNAVTLGEMAVGLGLIFGLFTFAAAFFAFFMNINFLLAGTVSVNPIWLLIALSIMLAHRVAGSWGLDRFVQPYCAKLHTKFCHCGKPQSP